MPAPTVTNETLGRQRAVNPLGGEIWLARQNGSVCAVLLGRDERRLRAEWRRRFPNEAWRERPPDETLARLLAYLGGERIDLNALPLAAKGTAFQQSVWAALRQIPYGETRSYGQLAAALGKPAGARAVGAACGQNPVALLIPCHRATRRDGALGGYYWGLEIKKALLRLESGALLPGRLLPLA